MARKKRIPYNPAAKIHDRRATEINRGQLGNIIYVKNIAPVTREIGQAEQLNKDQAQAIKNTEAAHEVDENINHLSDDDVHKQLSEWNTKQ